MTMSAREEGGGVTVIAVITLVIGMWWVFGELQDALNTIGGVRPRPGRGFLVPSSGSGSGPSLLVVGIWFPAARLPGGHRPWLAALGGFFLPPPARPPRWCWRWSTSLFSFCSITFLFGMIFKLLPDVDVAWRDVWLGAALTSLLFTLGKARHRPLPGSGPSISASAYGAAGSLGCRPGSGSTTPRRSFFFGAEFTKVWARRRARARCRHRRRCR